jgi:hypothetical protein
MGFTLLWQPFPDKFFLTPHSSRDLIYSFTSMLSSPSTQDLFLLLPPCSPVTAASYTWSSPGPEPYLPMFYLPTHQSPHITEGLADSQSRINSWGPDYLHNFIITFGFTFTCLIFQLKQVPQGQRLSCFSSWCVFKCLSLRLGVQLSGRALAWPVLPAPKVYSWLGTLWPFLKTLDEVACLACTGGPTPWKSANKTGWSLNYSDFLPYQWERNCLHPSQALRSNLLGGKDLGTRIGGLEDLSLAWRQTYSLLQAACFRSLLWPAQVPSLALPP